MDFDDQLKLGANTVIIPFSNFAKFRLVLSSFEATTLARLKSKYPYYVPVWKSTLNTLPAPVGIALFEGE